MTDDSAPAEENPITEETPAEEEALIQEEEPAEEEAPAEEEQPDEEETPAPEEQPAEEEAPAPEEIPTEEETPAPEEQPAVEDEVLTDEPDAETPEEELLLEDVEVEETAAEEPMLATQTVSYLNESLQTKSMSATQITADMEELSSGWYFVSGTVTLTNRLNIGLSSDSTARVYLILCDNAVLNAPKGIYVGFGRSLTIYSQSTGNSQGQLIAATDGNAHRAAIGGNFEDDKTALTGSITINGGDISAVSTGSGGNGIGGSTATITINRGTVYAEGCPGIGGHSISPATVNINGGYVTAVGTSTGSGVGGSGMSSMDGFTLNMTGGMLSATAGPGQQEGEDEWIQAIGSGSYLHTVLGQGSVTLSNNCVVWIGETEGTARPITPSTYLSNRHDKDGTAEYGEENYYQNREYRYVRIKSIETPAPNPTPVVGDYSVWTSSNSLPMQEGNYKLEGDVTLSKVWNPPQASTINLNLNGRTIKQTGEYPIIEMTQPGAVVNVFDSSGGGKLEGNVNVWNNKGSGVRVKAGVFQLYGGTITGCASSGYGGIQVEGGIVRLYGGTISGNACRYAAGGGIQLLSGSLAVSGNVNISGNYCEMQDDEDDMTAGPASDLMFRKESLGKFSVMGKLDASARIGIAVYTDKYGYAVKLPATLSSGLKGNGSLSNFFLVTPAKSNNLQNAELYIDSSGELAAREPGTGDVVDPGDTPGDNPALIALTGASVSISPKTYNGKAQTAAVTVKLNGGELTKDTDYTLSGDTQTNAGNHTVTVTGKGRYTGTVSGTFTINKAEMTSPGDKKVAVGKTVSVKTTGGKVTYSTKDTAIATVNSSTGVVTGKGAGVASITITDAGSANYKASTKTVKVTVSCAAPTIKKLENVKGGIKLTISKPTGARMFEILCKSGSGAWKSVGYTTGTTYTAKTRDGKNALKAGTKYTFTVRCVDKNNKKTVVSTYSKTGKAWVYAPVTSLSKVTNSKTKTAKPTWKKSAGITGYEVQHSLSKTFASKNKSVKVKGAAKLTTSIGSLTKGKTYYFRVRTYVASGGKTYPSAWSAAVKVKISK